MPALQTDVLIVGGGLAGLSLAWQCHQRGIDYRLIEARDRLGGRVLSQAVTGVRPGSDPRQTSYFDLGPSWFWPGQPRIARIKSRTNPRMSSKREELAQVATELVQLGGMGALSFRLLADRVGVKSSSVHCYFPETAI